MQTIICHSDSGYYEKKASKGLILYHKDDTNLTMITFEDQDPKMDKAQ